MKIAFIIALIINLISLITFANTYRKISQSKNCWGTVIDLPVSVDSDGGSTYGILAEFIAQNGYTYTYQSSWSSSTPRYKVGESIRIYYNSNNPSDNGIMSFMGAYGGSFIMFVLSAAAIIIVLGFIHSYRLIELIHPARF